MGYYNKRADAQKKLKKDDMFLTARQKSKKDFALAKEMIDMVDGTLRQDINHIHAINENWHLHAGEWPELDYYLGKDAVAFKNEDGKMESMNLHDFIMHHPKLNNVTSYIMGDIIMQPLVPIVRDFSTYGRKHREQERLGRLKQHYNDQLLQPKMQLITAQYYEEIGVQDPMSLNPEEQRQVQSDLQRRIKQNLPRELLEDMSKIKTPDEKIKEALLHYDIQAYELEEKFVQGGEQAVVSYQEYYRLGREGLKPTFESLNSKWVQWAGDENCDYAEDGHMAKYEQFRTIHSFVSKWGREVIKKPGFLKEVKKYFTEIPGYYRDGNRFATRDEEDMFIVEQERDFTDAIGENPELIQNDWRTKAGQQEIAALYNALAGAHNSGHAIREVYVVFKWTEKMTYVQREEHGEINEYMFSADYKRDPAKDIIYREFPINRVYHGTKVADRFYVGVEPVPWQFFGGVYDMKPKLTICGRDYARDNGNDLRTTLLEPAKQYQLRYNVSASKLEELEKNDIGKIIFWDRNMRPDGWSETQYMSAMVKNRNVPFNRHQAQQAGGQNKPFFVEDAGSTAKMNEYRLSMDMWEKEMYKAVGLNADTLGNANQYQSNALTQSNIQGSQKQLLPFHNKRRLLKQRVLNYFANISLQCLIDDKEKQAILLDDFSRLHLEINADDILGSLCPIFIIDDFDESNNVERIRQHILALLQKPGTSVKDVISLLKAKTVSEMEDVAESTEAKEREAGEAQAEADAAAQERQAAALKELQETEHLKKLELAQIDSAIKKYQSDQLSLINLHGADSDQNRVPDVVQRVMLEIAAEDKKQAKQHAHEKDLKRMDAKDKVGK